MQGFDPEVDLVRIGLANQTTMLRNETMTIGKMLEKAMLQKYGPAELKDHYMVLDTICDATQVCWHLYLMLILAGVCPSHHSTALDVLCSCVSLANLMGTIKGKPKATVLLFGPGLRDQH